LRYQKLDVIFDLGHDLCEEYRVLRTREGHGVEDEDAAREQGQLFLAMVAVVI
jgi:hypothetical protein